MKNKTGKEFFSRSRFQRHMRAQWKEKNFKMEMEGKRVGISIDQLVRHAKSRNAKIKTPYLDTWICILDEMISWQISLLTVIYSLRPKERITDFDRSIIVVLGKIVSDSLAMRQLIVAGHDVAARTILRSLGEYTEVFVAILDEPKFSKVFLKSDTPEGAKQFWKNHIAWGRLQRRTENAWKNWFKEEHPEAATWFANWGRSSNAKLSALIHPSYAGGLFSALPFKTSHNSEKWLGIWGDRSDGSVDTIYIYVSFMFPMLLLYHQFPFRGFSRYLGERIPFDEKNEFHKHVKEGRLILASLILSLGNEKDHSYIFPEYDLSIFPQSKNNRRRTRERRHRR